MSVAMLSSVNASFYKSTVSPPVTSNSATSAVQAPAGPAPRRHDQDDDDRPRMQQNPLVNAMMAAFRALGVGQAAPSSTPSAAPATSATSSSSALASPATTEPAPATPVAGATTPPVSTTPSSTATAATDSQAASASLEKAVSEFAHVLFNVLHRQGRSEHGESDHGGEHVKKHEGRRSAGYDGLAQRLEKLAQSLGASSVAIASTPASTGTPTTAPAGGTAAPSPPVVETTASAATVAATQSPSPAPSRGLSRLLESFGKVLGLLQVSPASGTPSTAATGASAATTPASTPSSGTSAAVAPSAAEQLKLFLTTLAQALHANSAGPEPSAMGSRLNVTA